MQNIPSLVVSAVSEWNGKALTKGSKQISGLEKSVKSLGRTLGVALSAAAVIQFSKASVKAFAKDEAAATRLSKAVQNLGLGFEDARIKNFISDLERTANVADDVLRPAFQSLLQTTGSVAKSQDLLNLALDISAGSGVDVAEVSKDLSLAYLGQNKGLLKYNTGLTKTELTTAGFTTIQTKLNEQYSGQNVARLGTYQGKMDALNISFGNAQETIGKGLVDSFILLAGDNGIGGVTSAIDDMAESISGAVTATGVLLAELKKIPALAAIGNFLKNPLGLQQENLLFGKGGLLDQFIATGQAPKPFSTGMTISGANVNQAKIDKDRAAAEAAAAKRQKELLAFTKKAALAEKNKLSLSKAAAVFDTNRISIAAALQATYDKETRLRLEALMAIEDEDGATALARIGELAAFQKNADLQKLAGVKTISSATLEAINTQLLTELAAINSSKMAEADKEIARNTAFGKYNAAILAAGELADKASYNERVQIQLTEIARLASLSKSTNAAITATNLREQAELNMIDRVAAAQKAADDARYAALKAYIALLSSLGTSTSTSSSSKGTSDTVASKQIADILALKSIATPGSQADFRLSESLGNLTMFDAPSIPQQYGPGAFDRDIIVNVSAGVIGSEETIVSAVQDALQTLNRRGDSITTAGAL